jgi:hypothetical protein
VTNCVDCKLLDHERYVSAELHSCSCNTDRSPWIRVQKTDKGFCQCRSYQTLDARSASRSVRVDWLPSSRDGVFLIVCFLLAPLRDSPCPTRSSEQVTFLPGSWPSLCHISEAGILYIPHISQSLEWRPEAGMQLQLCPLFRIQRSASNFSRAYNFDSCRRLQFWPTELKIPVL